MKIYRSLFLSIVFMLICVSAHAGERGTWVVRFDIDTPEKVKDICSAENQRQFDHYLVQVRGRADSWYESSFVPKAEGVDFDPLAAIIEACSDVEIHAWVNVYYLWTGDTPPEDLRHPYYNDAWILKDRNGRSVKEYSELLQRQHWIEGVYVDPASVEYRTYFSRVVREIVEKYDVAGVHLDFVRYPGAFFGDDESPILSKITRGEFATYLNKSGDADHLAVLAERLAWEQKRADNVTSLVREVKGTLDAVNPDLTLSASVFPDIVESFLDKGQKWTDWLAEGLLDDVYIMAYFGNPERVQSQLEQCKNICDRFAVKMWAGLGAYIKTAEEIRGEISQANRTGVNDICLFSLGHLLKQKKKVATYQLDLEVTGPSELHEPLLPLVEHVLADSFESNYLSHRGVYPTDKSIRLRGIFRYVDSHDDYNKVQEQYEIMQKVDDALKQGIPFVQLSRQYSQAGTKRHGGLLPDLHYSDAKTMALQRLFQLKQGGVSGIIPVHNGFWIFQVL